MSSLDDDRAWTQDLLHRLGINGTHDDDGHDDQVFLDWADLFSGDDIDEDWLYDGVFALGRGHAFYAQHKQGKSLFVLWVAAELATKRTDVDVVYLDYEMTRGDVRERLEEMGYGPTSDLSRLHYALLPSIAPLDTMQGAGELLDLIDSVTVDDRHVFVVVDTTARAAQGKENDSDTFRDFYRCTGIVLKRRGITWARLDHAGKDATRGQRGSSGKGDDVDVIWKLVAGDNGITLHRDAARMSWVDGPMIFNMRSDPLRYERGLVNCPAGTHELMIRLDELAVPLDAGRPKARKILRAADVPATNTVLSAALKWRRIEAEKLSVLTPDSPNENGTKLSTDSNGQHPQTPTSQPQKLSTDSFGQVPAVRGPVSVSLDTDRSDGPPLICIRCGGPPDHPPTSHEPWPAKDEDF